MALLREKVRVLLELQPQDLPLIARQRPLRALGAAVGGDSVGRSSIDTAQRSRCSTRPPRGGSTMPRNESLRRDLLEMASLDRVPRAELAASGDLFDTGYKTQMARVHARNGQRLRRVIESVGWPGTDLVGPDGAEAA